MSNPFVLARARTKPKAKVCSMKSTTIPVVQTISAVQATIAASQFSGDWRAKKYHRKRIRFYGESNRDFLRALGARIKMSSN
jgi:hypothetical protein